MTEVERHPEPVDGYLRRLYDPQHRRWACEAASRAQFDAWQGDARAALRDILSLPLIEAQSGRASAQVEWDDDVVEVKDDDGGSIQRRRGWILTEPSVRTAFWCLRPSGAGPFPLAVTPHGHENGDIYAGITTDDANQQRMIAEDRDVAVQAARRGYLAIAPATRGIGSNPSSFRVDDIAGRHSGRHCVCHNWQAVTAGRSALGERVWDLIRILDWAQSLPEVSGPTLMLGNSGGGVATLHTAAVDERVDIAVSGCAFNNYVSPAGTLRHCPCNAVPGLLSFGELWDVAALVAPRALLTVNGRHDGLHPTHEVDAAVEHLRQRFTAAGAPSLYEHRYGESGHRFYADLMWPWIESRRKELQA